MLLDIAQIEIYNIRAYIRQENRSQINNLTFSLRPRGKNKLKRIRREEKQ